MKDRIAYVLLAMVLSLVGVAWAGHEQRLGFLEVTANTRSIKVSMNEQAIVTIYTHLKDIEQKVDWLVCREFVSTSDQPALCGPKP
jgi:hypothetical protein